MLSNLPSPSFMGNTFLNLHTLLCVAYLSKFEGTDIQQNKKCLLTLLFSWTYCINLAYFIYMGIFYDLVLNVCQCMNINGWKISTVLYGSPQIRKYVKILNYEIDKVRPFLQFNSTNVDSSSFCRKIKTN